MVDWADYGSQVLQSFYGHDSETRAQWRSTLEALLVKVKEEEYFARILSSNLKRTYQFPEVEDFSNSHYIYNQESAKDQMERYLQAIEAKKAPVLAMQWQVQFLNLALGYHPRQMVQVTMTLEGSRPNQRYLDKYLELFEDGIEQHVP